MSILDNAKDIAELIKKYNDQELYQRIIDLRDEIFELKEENRLLRERLVENQNWDDKASQYKLTKTSGGAVVYESKEPPLHFACPSCFEQKLVHILQDNRTYSGSYNCPKCKANYPINPSGPNAGVAFG